MIRNTFNWHFCRLKDAEKSAAEDKERFRDLEERLTRTEQFAEQTMSSDSQAKQQLAQVQKSLEVTFVLTSSYCTWHPLHAPS